MQDRPLYENTFNQAVTTNRLYRRIALASSILAGSVLAFYLLQ